MTTPLHELEAQVLDSEPVQSFESEAKTEAAWINEALRREAGVKAGRSKLIPGSLAMARVRARLRPPDKGC